jgi:queuine tRNA-ribosyltransferase
MFGGTGNYNCGVSLRFDITARSGAGRTGVLHTSHGDVETPVFMPVGTVATVKGVPQDLLEELGVELVLANTYHLYLRPGHELIRGLGGLHKFMSWERALLTDSGGFQVFSLSGLRKVTEDGVEFRSHLDGSAHQFTPESATEVQIALGADLIMALDECPEYPAERGRIRESMELTLRWAKRSREYFLVHKEEVPWRKEAGGRGQEAGTQAQFGIIQGGSYADLRKESAERTIALDFDGYAIGGVSVGEPRHLSQETVAATLPLLPEDKPRYLMGVGYPEEIEAYARLGVDMMDCVLPTRAARHGLLFTSEGRLNIKNARFAADQGPLDPACGCKVCARYSRAYLRHLYTANESLAAALNTVHNLAHYVDRMRAVRHSIKLGDTAKAHSD